MKIYSKSLFIFHRDLRLSDNTALIEALKSSRGVIPCFILDERQLALNPFRSDRAVGFMLDSLENLNRDLQKGGGRLYCFSGFSHEVLEKILKDERIDAVFSNRDYTPFAIHRDLALEDVCRRSGLPFIQRDDYLLHAPEEVRKKDGGVYTVFTPFFKMTASIPVRPVVSNTYKNYAPCHVNALPDSIVRDLRDKVSAADVAPGRNAALKILREIERCRNYVKGHDFPAVNVTTGLSAHIKFGNISIREVYHAFGDAFGHGHALVRQLYWRDFFTHIGFHYPHVLSGAFNEKYDDLPWKNDPVGFEAWREGRTGVPIVDAGMRELKQTGKMHNRVRMITASFLVKDLHIDWRWGEKYFARQLVDYDPFVNNGNWQWAASTGCDAQPYFRVFNPWRQQRRFDPRCVYIKKWVHELKDFSAEEIHSLQRRPSLRPTDYPPSIVDHARESQIAKKMYRR